MANEYNDLYLCAVHALQWLDPIVYKTNGKKYISMLTFT